MKHHTTTTTTTHNTKDTTTTTDINCSYCKMSIKELESGRRSPIVMSPTTSAKFQRRRGVSERNPMERKLVSDAMKVAMVNQTLISWGFRFRETGHHCKCNLIYRVDKVLQPVCGTKVSSQTNIDNIFIKNNV